jgi:hypothetical protein
MGVGFCTLNFSTSTGRAEYNTRRLSELVLSIAEVAEA